MSRTLPGKEVGQKSYVRIESSQDGLKIWLEVYRTWEEGLHGVAATREG
jgi:hypothetical protein